MVPFGRHLASLADAQPDRPAVTDDDRTISRAGLARESTALAHHLADLGVGAGDFVTVALPNGIPFVRALVACWKLGAIPQPVSSRLPAPELAAIVELAGPTALIGVDATLVDPAVIGDRPVVAAGWSPDSIDLTARQPLTDAVSPSWKAPTSGGSTGRPKLIVHGERGELDPDADPILLIRRDGCLVMPGPLYHNGPLAWTCLTLLAGGHVVVLGRFDPEATLDAIEQHRADMVYLVPTMMRRIWRLGSERLASWDLSSLRVVWHLAEPCPDWLKEAWIEWLGPKRIWELYAGTENQASTVIRGDQWLEHRGSVGRVSVGEIAIFDDAGAPLGPGAVGEVYLRRGAPGTTAAPTYRYVGADTDRIAGGWESLGDLGWMDADGYLYLADRKTDMILSGGANIYPAEIEAALDSHPAVHSSAVIGLPDEDRTNVVHAIVQADPDEVTVAELLAFLADRLVRYKIPRSIEFTDEPLRDDAGKVRRSRLRSERVVT